LTVFEDALIASTPILAPMVLDQSGRGRQIKGELYEISEAALSRLDALESVGQPGNTRTVVEVDPLGPGDACRAIVYVKSPELASPIHSGYLEDYQDRRFIPPRHRQSAPKRAPGS
jgi:gamma-glutamylaminecyclotransferase